MSVGIRQAAARGGSWSPLGLPSLMVWLDGSDAATITMSGSNVATWADKSGTGRYVVPSLARLCEARHSQEHP